MKPVIEGSTNTIVSPNDSMKAASEVQTHAVGFSMDGFRRQLSENVGELRDAIKGIISEGYDCDPSELTDLMNAVICDSNVINCVFIDDVKSFSDLSDVELGLIDLESR